MKRTNERGSALAAALVLTVLAAGLVAALVTFSFPYIRTTQAFNEKVYAVYAAEAGLEEAKVQIANSDYDDVGNLWLMNNSAAAPTGELVYDDLQVGNATVDVRVYSLDDEFQFYRVEATATYGQRTVTLSWELRARDTFAKYMFFVDADNLSVGTTTVRGYVYAGKKLINNYGGAVYHKYVEARQGIVHQNGATTSNTSYIDGYDDAAPQTQMPSTNEIATLHTKVENPIFNVQNSSSAYQGGGSMNTYITMNGDQMTMVAKKTTNGQVVNSYTGPIPSNGLVFSQGDVYIKGDVSGRLTVATMGKTYITDRIRYTDQDGDLAYVLKKDGDVIPDNYVADWTQKWDGPGYEYVPNESFNPQEGESPTLGLLSAGDVVIVDGAPKNMEMHAAVFSATGRWYCDLTSYKGNLKVLGSLVQNKGGWRYSGATQKGYAKSGEYIYDNQLLIDPPPFYLKVDKPMWGPRWESSSS